MFQTSRPRKKFSLHFKRLCLSVAMHQFQVNYWTSFSQQRGILLNVARGINLSTENVLSILPYKDSLKDAPVPTGQCHSSTLNLQPVKSGFSRLCLVTPVQESRTLLHLLWQTIQLCHPLPPAGIRWAAGENSPVEVLLLLCGEGGVHENG